MEFLFHRVYEMADHVSTMTNVYPSFEELPWDSPEVSRCLHRFSKASVLGHFCFTHIQLQDLRTARKDPENFDIADLEAALERYTIPFVSFQEFMRNNHPDEQEDAYIELEHLHSWMVSQENEAFAALWERMTEEVFHLLFGNRGFLLEFTARRSLLEAAPSVPMPTWTPMSSIFAIGATPDPSFRLLVGLCATPAPASYSVRISPSSTWTQCAARTCEQCGSASGRPPVNPSFSASC